MTPATPSEYGFIGLRRPGPAGIRAKIRTAANATPWSMRR